MRFLPASVHQALDFIVGAALLFAPYIFGFSEVGGMAVLLPQIIGAVAIVSGLITRGYGFAVARIIPLKTHMTMDFLAGALLAISPWLFGFADEEPNAWVPHLIVGLALVVVSLVTRTDADTERPADNA